MRIGSSVVAAGVVFCAALGAGCGSSGGECIEGGQACTPGSRCCTGFTCFSGRCILTDACTAVSPCTAGAAGGQCCGAFPYCVGERDAEGKRCATACGAVGKTCGIDSDCCSQTCRFGICVDLSVELVQLGQNCQSAAGCGEASLDCFRFHDATSGFCSRDCSVDADCGPKGMCAEGTCVRPCPAASCGTGSLCWALGICLPDCRVAAGDFCGTRQECGAQGECAETGCTRRDGTCGLTNECCVAAPYCQGVQAGRLICQENCGAAGAFCSTSGDCCAQHACLSGRCQVLCQGDPCSGGLARGGCCASAPYCTASAPLDPRTCSASCGAAFSGCVDSLDCCSGFVCQSGGCVACRGNGSSCSAAQPCCPQLRCVSNVCRF